LALARRVWCTAARSAPRVRCRQFAAVAVADDTFRGKIQDAEGPVLVACLADWHRDSTATKEMVEEAGQQSGIPCFYADLDMNPIVARVTGVNCVPAVQLWVSGRLLSTRSGALHPDDVTKLASHGESFLPAGGRQGDSLDGAVARAKHWLQEGNTVKARAAFNLVETRWPEALFTATCGKLRCAVHEISAHCRGEAVLSDSQLTETYKELQDCNHALHHDFDDVFPTAAASEPGLREAIALAELLVQWGNGPRPTVEEALAAPVREMKDKEVLPRIALSLFVAGHVVEGMEAALRFYTVQVSPRLDMMAQEPHRFPVYSRDLLTTMLVVLGPKDERAQRLLHKLEFALYTKKWNPTPVRLNQLGVNYPGFRSSQYDDGKWKQGSRARLIKNNNTWKTGNSSNHKDWSGNLSLIPGKRK